MPGDSNVTTAEPDPSVPISSEGGGDESLLGSEHPVLLSCVLKIATDITYEARQEFIRKSQEIFAKSKKTIYEKAWITDYLEHQGQLFLKPLHREPTATSANGSEFSLAQDHLHLDHGSGSSTPPITAHRSSEVKPLNLNKLFVKPDFFDGVKPSARQWLDQYEKAAISNGWSDPAKVRYMTTFLKDTAYSWLTEIVPMQAPGADWTNLRALFVKCYLGESDRQAAQRELNRAMQKEGEKAAQFIPRMVQMIRISHPDRDQAAITDDIRQKLLPDYQEKLIMFELRTIQHLYDACTKIEAGASASRAATRQRERAASINRLKRSGKTKPPDERSAAEDDSSSDEEFTSPASKSNLQKLACFRCGRHNHWARDCTAKTKLDGSPIEETSPEDRSKPFRSQGSIDFISGHESPSSGRVGRSFIEPRTPTLNSIRSAGRDFICSILKPNNTPQLALTNSPGLIQHEVRCDGISFHALIDTGARSCIVDSNVARQLRWKYRTSSVWLFNVLGQNMDCLGDATADVSLSLGNVTRTIDQQFNVVQNLCVPMILGMDAIRRFHLVLNASSKQQLQFASQKRKVSAVTRSARVTPSVKQCSHEEGSDNLLAQALKQRDKTPDARANLYVAQTPLRDSCNHRFKQHLREMSRRELPLSV